MSISAVAVRRPVATAMVFLALIVVGTFSFFRLAVDLFPSLDFPSISVVTTYSGVSPEEMETLVTRPIESAIARVEGIDRIESFSSEGRSRVALRFDWGVNLETALNDVRAAIERVRATLPEDVDAPVVYKFDLTNLPVLDLALSGDMDEGDLRRFADDVVGPTLERVNGVASVDVRGARQREIRVELDPAALIAYELSPTDVASAVRSESVTVPAGVIEDGDANILVRAMGEFASIADIADAVIAWRGDEPVRLSDVATVIDGYEDVTNIVLINGELGVRISVTKSPGANTIQVARALHEAIEQFNIDFENIANMRVMSDSSVFVERSITGVQQSVMYGALLALIVLMLFLQSIRSTIVIGVAIPISVIATFLLMNQLGLTLNLITFGGLALGIGMLVDNAIVILENIYRHREAGVPADEAAIKGSDEVGSAIIASTLTTLAVFLPVLFLGGFAAVFFGQMAMVVASALLCSLFVALTLVPVLASVLLKNFKPQKAESRNPVRRALDGLDRFYSRTVHWALRGSPIVVLVAVALLFGAWQMRGQVGSELLPETDESEIRVFAKYPVGTRIEITAEAIANIERLVRENVPEATDIQSTVGTPGFWSTSGEETGSLRINLVPVEDRTRSSQEIADSVRPILQQEIPGMFVFSRAGGGLWIFNYLRGGDARVNVEIRGHDLDTADQLAVEVAELVQSIEGVTDARPSRQDGGDELQLYVDRTRAADYGMTTRDVSTLVSTLVQGADAGIYREGGDEYRIRLRLADEELRSVDGLLSTPVSIPGGGYVALRELVWLGDGVTPQAIERLNQERIVRVTGGIEEDADLGAINAQIQEGIRGLAVPEGFSVLVAGEGAEQESVFAEMGLGWILALLLVYMVMAGQFESFIQPIVILASVPFAAIGVIATLILTDTTININSFMGIIVLVGVVVNNAIVLVDYINLMRREHGYELRPAIVEAARRRLRPILMTTATTVLALIPVAIGGGTGDESQAPLARVVVGGMISSTMITLFIVPILYMWTESFKGWISRIGKSNDDPPADSPGDDGAFEPSPQSV